MSRCKQYSAGAYVETRGSIEPALCQKGFDKVKGGTAFNIDRPSFKSGTTIVDMKNVSELKPSKRSGLGNYAITRNNFISPPIRGRETIDFERLQALNIEQEGIRVQLGDKTIEKLFKIQIDDPTDVAWITERNRRLQAGDSHEQIQLDPPLGRPQRKLSRMTNFSEQQLSLEDKIEQLTSAVTQGVADSQAERGIIAGQIATLLGNVDNLQKMNKYQIKSIQNIISQLGISSKWQVYFRDLGRIIDIKTFNANKGPIVMFLLTNIPSGRSLNEPLMSWNSSSRDYRPASFLQLFRMGASSRYLDLENRTIDTLESLLLKGIDFSEVRPSDVVIPSSSSTTLIPMQTLK